MPCGEGNVRFVTQQIPLICGVKVLHLIVTTRALVLPNMSTLSPRARGPQEYISGRPPAPIPQPLNTPTPALQPLNIPLHSIANKIYELQ